MFFYKSTCTFLIPRTGYRVCIVEESDQMYKKIQSMPRDHPELRSARESYEKRQKALTEQISQCHQSRLVNLTFSDRTKFCILPLHLRSRVLQGIAQRYTEMARELERIVRDVWSEIDKWHHSKKMEVNQLARPREGCIDYLDKM